MAALAVDLGERKALARVVRARASEAEVAHPSSPVLPWRRAAREAAVFWLGTRLVYAALTWASVVFGDISVSQKTPAAAVPPDRLLVHWWIWDAAFYGHIAVRGFDIPGTQRFFPLYPALVRLFMRPVGLHGGIATLAVEMSLSALATLAAFYGLALLAAHEGVWTPAPRLATPAIHALAAFPLALFLFAGYADALFLALAVWALLAARRGWWRAAAVCAASAALARPTGLALALPLAWEYARTHGWLRDPRAWRVPRGRALTQRGGEAAAVLLAVPGGIGIWGAYCARRWGDPLIWLHAQGNASGRVLMPPWEGAWLAVRQAAALPAWSYLQARTLLDLLPLAWLIFAAIWLAFPARWHLSAFGLSLRIERPAQPVIYTLYLAGLVALFTAAPAVHDQFPDMLQGDGRYVLAAVPLWLAAGRWLAGHPHAEGVLLAAGWALQAVLVVFVLNGGWLV